MALAEREPRGAAEAKAPHFHRAPRGKASQMDKRGLLNFSHLHTVTVTHRPRYVLVCRSIKVTQQPLVVLPRTTSRRQHPPATLDQDADVLLVPRDLHSFEESRAVDKLRCINALALLCVRSL